MYKAYSEYELEPSALSVGRSGSQKKNSTSKAICALNRWMRIRNLQARYLGKEFSRICRKRPNSQRRHDPEYYNRNGVCLKQIASRAFFFEYLSSRSRHHNGSSYKCFTLIRICGADKSVDTYKSS